MDNYPRHIVAATGVILNAEGQVLLVRTHRRGWEAPGGQVELGEALLDALQREVYEESGCRIDAERLIGVYSNIGTLHIVIFAFRCRYVAGDLRPSEETPGLGWFSRNEALGMVTHPPARALLADGFADHPGVIFRSYTTRPYTPRSDVYLHDERE